MGGIKTRVECVKYTNIMVLQSLQLVRLQKLHKITSLRTSQRKNPQLICIDFNHASQFPFKLILLTQARLHQHQNQHL